MTNKLPPIPEESFDGEKYKLDLKDHPFPKCPHKNITVISGSEIRCSCGAGWQGANIAKLKSLLQSSP